jgi:hypothetical protein
LRLQLRFALEGNLTHLQHRSMRAIWSLILFLVFLLSPRPLLPHLFDPLLLFSAACLTRLFKADAL